MSIRNGGYGRTNSNYRVRNNGGSGSHFQQDEYNSRGGVIAGNNNSRSSNAFVKKNSQIYMGDLDTNWDETTIKQIWSSLGEGSVDVKLMWNNGSGGMNTTGKRQNLGYCFVDFPSYSHASNALLKNGMAIPGFSLKTLKLNWASSSSSSSSSFGASNQELSIFVGDLAPNVTEAQLFELFIRQYPSTAHAKVVYDQLTSVSKGYAFIRFGDAVDQQRALAEMQGTFLNGRAIRVSNAGHQHQQSSATRVDSRVKSNTTGNRKNLETNSGRAVNSSQFMFPVQQEPSLTNFTDPNNTTVFIGGLSLLVTEEHLRLYFQPFGQIVYVKIPPGKQCGFVQFVNRVSAETAICRMQGFPICDSRIRTSWGRPAKQTTIMEQAVAQNLRPDQFQPQHQPSLQQPTFAYDPSAIFHQTHCLQISSEASSQPNLADPSLLLPGYQSLMFSPPSHNSSGLYSPYADVGMDLLRQKQEVRSNDGEQKPTLLPQLLVDDEKAFANSKSESLDRLEKGSNGFIFA